MRRVITLVIVTAALGACSGDDTATPSTTAPADVEDGAEEGTAPSTVAVTAPPIVVTVPEGGGTATGRLDEADVQIETDEGTVQIGVAEVPASTADDFPIPDDLDVQLSSETGSEAGFSGVSGRTIAELAEFYVAGLEAAGYTITDRQEIDGVLAVYGFEREGEVGQVAISEAPGGGSSVLVTIGDAPAD